MKKYSIIQNDYKLTTEIRKELIQSLDKKQWVEDENNPEYIFVLGRYWILFIHIYFVLAHI